MPLASLGPKNEPSAVLDINLGRVPVMVTPQGSVGQTKAINSYLATTLGLNGKVWHSVHSYTQLLAKYYFFECADPHVRVV